MVVTAVWFEDGSEEAFQRNLRNFRSLKRQSDEDYAWLALNWHDNLNLKGWATVLDLGTSDETLIMLNTPWVILISVLPYIAVFYNGHENSVLLWQI